MNLHGFILSAGLVLAVCTACQQQAPQIPPPPPPPAPPLSARSISPICQSAGINSGADFVQRQTHIIAFDPPNNPQHLNLTGSSSASGTRFADDLSKAFEAAPQSFQGQLCGLDGVLINFAGCASPGCSGADPTSNSWALRENRHRNPQKGGRFIALSAALWGPAAHTVGYHAFETGVIRALLKRLGWPASDVNGPYYPSNPSDPTDTPAMTILAAMAHEVGHVLWYDINNPNRYDPGDPRYDPNTYCSAIGGFFGRSWITPVRAPPSWRKFGEISNDQHLSPPEMKDIKAAILRQDDSTASALVDQIYDTSQPWASLFAAFSADEDFVETFKLAVLLNANPPLQSLPIQFPYLGGKTENVPGTLAQRIELRNKLSCFQVKP
jgi:hypothetical protein